jgi:hypothetical protein
MRQKKLQRTLSKSICSQIRTYLPSGADLTNSYKRERQRFSKAEADL